MIAIPEKYRARNRIVGEMLSELAQERQTTILRKRVLIAMAKLRHGDKIKPCSNFKCTLGWDQCYTKDFGMMFFWYNDELGSTHIQFLQTEA
jgi:hypothetical protein